MGSVLNTIINTVVAIILIIALLFFTGAVQWTAVNFIDFRFILLFIMIISAISFFSILWVIIRYKIKKG